MSVNKLTLHIDASACTSCVGGSYTRLCGDDIWLYKDVTFEGGKIYGIVGEYGQGGTYLAYLAAGKIPAQDGVRIFLNNTEISREKLQIISFPLEPSGEKFAKYPVRKSIVYALKKSESKLTFEDIAEKFLLTPERYDMRFDRTSRERFRAAAAYGYVLNKKIYYFGYHSSSFYMHMCQSSLLKALRELSDCGAVVLLPVGSDYFIRHIADECIFIDRSLSGNIGGTDYDIIKELKERYEELFGMGDLIK